MFCFGLQSIARFINTNAPYFNTGIGWRVKENFPETFKSQYEKNKTRPQAQFLPRQASQPVNNIMSSNQSNCTT